MLVSIYVAASENGVIGKKNALPWYLPSDLARFKEVTMGHPIVMGRKTHESIGRALPGRRNIVITHQADYRAEGCEVVHSLNDALNLVKDEPEIFIIGGSAIYDQALPRADKIYFTDVKARIDGDIFFRFNPGEWAEKSREKHLADDKNQYDYDFVVLKRK